MSHSPDNRPNARTGALAYIGLGANLGDREMSIRRAAELIGVDRLSSIIETDPWGYEDQPRFLNAVAELRTEYPPRVLLEVLLEVEQRLGRDRTGPRYGPRKIDLDLLLYGDQSIEEPGLQVPHPRLHERLFVLEPLAELAPELRIPGRGTVLEALAGLQSDP
jgi:2-amino-4-hydroxy-6-hydroxymethyldihydropteridine diphosphokinase